MGRKKKNLVFNDSLLTASAAPPEQLGASIGASVRQYRVQIKTSEGTGCILAEYTGGCLSKIDSLFDWATVKSGTVDNISAVVVPVTWRECDLLEYIKKYAHILSIVEEPVTVNKKIALFCAKYKDKFGCQYYVSVTEAKRLKTVIVTDELLDTYFLLPNKYPFAVKSIANYSSYINEIVRLNKGGDLPIKTTYPNEWSVVSEKMVADHYGAGGLMEYWKHLRLLGWFPETTNGRRIWKKIK